MDWIRSWIMQIAEIIVLGALCDMVMPEGDVRKYVKMVIGLILAFAVLKPIVNIPEHEIHIDIPKDQRIEAMELKEKLSKLEQKQIISIYCRKIEDKIVDEVRKVCSCEIFVNVKVEEEEKLTFGNITEVEIVCSGETEGVDGEKLKSIVCMEFGVDKESVQVQMN